MLLGIAVLGAMVVVGREARAGISLTGGFKPTTGDPTYDYSFEVYLDPGDTITTGDSFTIDALPGVVPKTAYKSLKLPSYSLTGEPDDPPGVIWTPSISLLSTTKYPDPYKSNITWTFYGDTPIVNPAGSGQKIDLGEFDVVTAVNFATNPPVTNGTPVNYAYTVLGGNGKSSSGTGIVELFSLVPEPSSATIVLLMGGTSGFLGLIARLRRRRPASHFGRLKAE